MKGLEMKRSNKERYWKEQKTLKILLSHQGLDTTTSHQECNVPNPPTDEEDATIPLSIQETIPMNIHT